MDDGRNERQDQLKYKNIRQCHPAERAVFRTEKCVAMLPKGLQRPKGPAETLADQLAGCFGSFGPGDSLFVVADAPAEAPDRNRRGYRLDRRDRKSTRLNSSHT